MFSSPCLYRLQKKEKDIIKKLTWLGNNKEIVRQKWDDRKRGRESQRDEENMREGRRYDKKEEEMRATRRMIEEQR